jgi:cation diffusion facilitator family transporter
MGVENIKKSAASLSIISNGLIILFKLGAGIITGSISIISEAVHSMSDFLASVLTFFAVMRSSKPADRDHPFGHGKYEDVAGFIEGFLILFAALYIIWESCKKIISHSHIEFDSTPGIIVMSVAIIANLLVSSYLFIIAKKTDSVALRADAQHLNTDVYSALGVLIGLVLIKITGITLLDPLIAILVAFIILKTGMSIIKETLNNLLDGTLPEEDIKIVENIINECNDIYGFKNFKSRKSGSNRDIDITILCEETMSIKQCHDICDELETKIQNVLPNTLITIHCEPYKR